MLEMANPGKGNRSKVLQASWAVSSLAEKKPSDRQSALGEQPAHVVHKHQWPRESSAVVDGKAR